MLQSKGAFQRYLKPACVVRLESSNREEVIHQLVEVAARVGLLEDPNLFEQAVLEREKIISTGIGLGIALPHAKLHGQKDFFICCALLPEGADWKAMDGEPCHLVFLIGGPDDQPSAYLQLLSQLTSLLREDDRRKQLLKSQTTDDILAILKGF